MIQSNYTDRLNRVKANTVIVWVCLFELRDVAL